MIVGRLPTSSAPNVAAVHAWLRSSYGSTIPILADVELGHTDSSRPREADMATAFIATTIPYVNARPRLGHAMEYVHANTSALPLDPP